ncbi:MAG TPA: VanZ family protein [Acidisarcina sp.]|nr:VanZ family protein [Acidisarcina sp.]
MSSSQSRANRLLSAWIPAICAIAVICWESTSQFSATNTSTPLRHLWEFLLGPVSNLAWGTIHHHIRKTGHLLGYGLLSGFLFRAWFLTIDFKTARRMLAWKVSAALALACTFLIASGDEIHQKFLPSRSSSPRDVAIDMAGALAMQLLTATILLLPSQARRIFDTET